jgi:CubicO group peptidase (beta-lactamase class C family)
MRTLLSIGVVCIAVIVSATVTVTAAPLQSAVPETVGLSSERLDRITDKFSRDIAAGVIPGAVILVARDGKIAYHRALGFQDRAAGEPMRRDSIFRIYSMTKPIFSVGAMSLVEEGALTLPEPISKYLPAYTDMTVGVPTTDPESGAEALEIVPADRPIKVHDLLRHTSGITYAFIGKGPVKDLYKEAGIASFSRDRTIADYADELAKLPLLWQPGTTWDYSRSTDILGAVIEKAAGQPVDEFLRARVLRPLGMDDTDFWVPPAKQGRVAQPQPDPETGAVDSLLDVTENPAMFAGGHGLMSTARDYARFCQMMLDGGALDGARILGPKTVAYMASDHLGTEISKDGTLYLPGAGYGFGLGFGVRTATGESPWPGSVGEYFWGGYAGTYFWIDPVERMVVVYMMQSVKHRLHYRMLLRNLVMQAIIESRS